MSVPELPGKLPLLFSFQFLVPGQGFVAYVELAGKVLRDEESIPGECWLYGADPGGFCGGGPDWPAASLDFQNAAYLILLDIAAEAPDLKAFRAIAKEAFGKPDQAAMADWDKALEVVRDRGMQLGDLPARHADECPPRVVVRELKVPKPFTNGPARWSTAAA